MRSSSRAALHEGTLGVFLHLREDPKWADITERNGSVRSHPVEWMAHSLTRATPAGAITGGPPGTQALPTA